MQFQECISCAGKVGWVGLVVSALLAVTKLVIGILSNSKALVVDSLYSAKDMVTSLLIIAGLKISRKPVDREHPYGHGKIEFILSLMVSLVFLGLTVYLFFFALEALKEEHHNIPHGIAVFVALISALANFSLYRYTHCVDREISSPMVETLSRHTKADSFSSMVVAVGVAYEHFFPGIPMDTYIAVVECLHLFFLGIETLRDSVNGLLDSSMPSGKVAVVRSISGEVEGVEDVREIKSRRTGSDYSIDIVIEVHPDLTILEARTISSGVEEKIMNKMKHIGHVRAHFISGNPENHESI